MLLKNIQTGYEKAAPEGFSWTTFFFNFMVPLMRGDYKHTILFIIFFFYASYLPLFIFKNVVAIIPYIIGYSAIIGIRYNHLYIEVLKEKGYVPIEEFQKRKKELLEL